MKPEAQQIAIALACGHRWYWTVYGLTPDFSAFTWRANLCFPLEGGIAKVGVGCANETRHMTAEEIAEVVLTGDYISYAPRYTESLDAMHEAEQTTFRDDIKAWSDYESEVSSVFMRAGGQWRPILSATAAQRAEAFLRVKGLWRESAI